MIGLLMNIAGWHVIVNYSVCWSHSSLVEAKELKAKDWLKYRALNYDNNNLFNTFIVIEYAVQDNTDWM